MSHEHGLEKNRAVLKVIHEFNLCPARYMHPSWIEDNYARLVMRSCMAGGDRSEKYISSMILDMLGHRYHYDFENGPSRLSLLSPAVMIRLVYYAGLAIHCDSIRTVIERDKLYALKKIFGSQALSFVAFRAGLLKGPNLNPAQEVESIEQLYNLVTNDGLKIFATCLCGQPEAVASRVRLKFPKTTRLNFQETGSDEDKGAAWFFVRRILKSELHAIWKDLFV